MRIKRGSKEDKAMEKRYGVKPGSKSDKVMEQTGKPPVKPPLGSGARFKALTGQLEAKGKVRNPAAVAAAIGRKKFGVAKMAELSAKGRKKK